MNQWGNIEFYDGYIKGLDGRPIYVPTERQCLVYALQSDEAIMMTKAYNLLHERLAKKYKWGEEYGIVSWYHKQHCGMKTLWIAGSPEMDNQQPRLGK